MGVLIPCWTAKSCSKSTDRTPSYNTNVKHQTWFVCQVKFNTCMWSWLYGSSCFVNVYLPANRNAFIQIMYVYSVSLSMHCITLQLLTGFVSCVLHVCITKTYFNECRYNLRKTNFKLFNTCTVDPKFVPIGLSSFGDLGVKWCQEVSRPRHS